VWVTKICLITISIVAVLVLGSPVGDTGAKEKIPWMITHWPPVMELDESRQMITGGQWGGQLQLLQKRLPNYDHTLINMSWSRFWHVVENGENLCNCMVLKNKEREETVVFSIPATIILPNQIIMKRTRAALLGDPDSLSLATLLTGGKLKGMFIMKRSYGAGIDGIIDRYKTSFNLETSVVNEKSNIMKLLHDRGDYIIEYPFTVNEIMGHHFPERKDELVNIPIQEVDPFYFVYFACPKTPWGRSVIKDVNKALGFLRSDEQFRSQLEKMYTREQLNTVWKLYDTHLLSPVKESSGPP
jgi:uncharacterized protein (TIGR02285 family)